MKSHRWLNVVRVAFVIAVCAPALFQLLLEARLYIARVGYPTDIEWLEGAALYQGERIMRFQATYGPPQGGYIPLNHPPVYTAFVGLIGHVVGISYKVGRTLSLLFFSGCLFFVMRAFLRHEERRLDGWAGGLLAIGCAAAGAPLCATFFDLIRGDTMAIFLCVLAAVMADARHADDQPKRWRPRRIALLSFVLTAALYARLPNVVFIVWVVLFVFGRNRRAGFLLALATAALCGLVLVALQFGTKGWYWIYTVSMAQNQRATLGGFLYGLGRMFKFAPFVAAIPVVVLVLGIKRRLSGRAVLWFGMLAAAFPACLIPFSKVGGFDNDFLPYPILLGPAALLAASDGVRALSRHPRVAATLRSLVYAGIAAFLVLRVYDLKPYLPKPDHAARAIALNAQVAALKGGAIAPRHPFVPLHNGHINSQLSEMPYLDAMWTGMKELRIGAYVDRIHAQWALISGTEIPVTASEIGPRYQLETAIDAPGMIIGERSQIRYLLRWQDDEKNARVIFDFEQPTLDGWTVTGNAFDSSPTTTRPKWQNAIAGAVGERLANSYNPTLRDSATGTLTSPPFLIDRPKMGLRVGGGGQSPKARVELRVGGRVEKTATSIFRGSETMLRIVWDVSKLQGKEAQIVILDQDSGSWGHILCDHVVLY